MDLDILWKAIVPLTFLAIWALTALFNRDAKALPPRAQSSDNPYGPRPAPPPRPPQRPAPLERSPTIRWAQPGGGYSAQSSGGLDDDIVIIETPRPVRPSPTRVVTPVRRAAKARAVQPTKPTQAMPMRVGLAGVSQSVNQSITGTLKLQPLSESSVATPVQSVTAASAATSIDAGDVKSGLAGVAAAFSDPKRLREAIIVNVILQPPVSLRGRGRRI